MVILWNAKPPLPRLRRTKPSSSNSASNTFICSAHRTRRGARRFRCRSVFRSSRRIAWAVRAYGREGSRRAHPRTQGRHHDPAEFASGSEGEDRSVGAASVLMAASSISFNPRSVWRCAPSTTLSVVPSPVPLTLHGGGYGRRVILNAAERGGEPPEGRWGRPPLGCLAFTAQSRVESATWCVTTMSVSPTSHYPRERGLDTRHAPRKT